MVEIAREKGRGGRARSEAPGNTNISEGRQKTTKRTERDGSEKWQGSQGRGESWKHREETISRKHLAEPNAKKRSSGVKAGEANGLSNQNSFTGTLKTEGCYFVSMCWQRSESVCSCWGNEPAEKQIKNIGELINDGETYLRRLGAGIKVRGRLTLERGDTPSFSTEGKEAGWVQTDDCSRLGMSS